MVGTLWYFAGSLAVVALSVALNSALGVTTLAIAARSQLVPGLFVALLGCFVFRLFALVSGRTPRAWIAFAGGFGLMLAMLGAVALLRVGEGDAAYLFGALALYLVGAAFLPLAVRHGA